MSESVCDIILDLVKEASTIGIVIYDMSDESYGKLKKLEDYISYQSVELCGWNELHQSIGDFLSE